MLRTDAGGEQRGLADRLLNVPGEFAAAVRGADQADVRRRPAPDEWSAIEVVGHMIDKMNAWRLRVERIAAENRPQIPPYDQDRSVRENRYQEAPPDSLLARLEESCRTFASVVGSLPPSALEREGIHAEYGPITLRQCVTIPLDAAVEHLRQLRQSLREATSSS